MILASAVNVPKLYAPEMTKPKKMRFCDPTVFDAQLLRNPLKYLREPYQSINLYYARRQHMQKHTIKTNTNYKLN